MVCHTMVNLRKNLGKIANNVMRKIALQICDSCFERKCSSSALNKNANRAHKARADWLNNFHSPWEFKGYKIESQNYQLRLTTSLI